MGRQGRRMGRGAQATRTCAAVTRAGTGFTGIRAVAVPFRMAGRCFLRRTTTAGRMLSLRVLQNALRREEGAAAVRSIGGKGYEHHRHQCRCYYSKRRY
ncbi:MAG TPA: hypothetical protein ENN65_08635 [Candidatus Hydrogenedentes bacterium]|nr:hypothetical protein [Candidatus Hydrogenedentota bacterium]